MAHNKKQKNNSGSALAYALVIMSSVMIILVSILGYISSQLKFSLNRVEKEKAFQIAEAGIYYYRWYLAHETSGKTAAEINTFLQTGGPMGFSPEAVDYSGIGEYQIVVTPPVTGSTIINVESTGWSNKAPGIKRTVKVRFRRPSWSEYAVLANDFMRFGEGTEVYGKIHSNGGIRFDGIAHNVISSLLPTVDDSDHTGVVEFGVHTHVRVPPQTGVSSSGLATEAGSVSPIPVRADVFEAGRQFPVAEVSFNGVISDLSLMKTEAKKPGGTTNNNCTATGCYFDSSDYGRHIVLNSNGTMTVRRVTNYDKNTYDTKGRVLYQGLNTITTESSSTTYTIPASGIIFVEDNIWLEGTINNKKITIVAANLGSGLPANVFLGINNLLYTNFNGNDIIGVIAQDNVEIVKNSLNTLVIDGAFLAQSGKVGREYYTCKRWQYDTCISWWGSTCSIWKNWSLVTPNDLSDDVQHCDDYNSDDHRNTITVNGSIATNQRYGFSWTDGTGYDTRNLNFDNNLLYFPPPFFPTGTEYAIDLWEEL
ncbi:MAG: pilus assembly PilX N-terminal domain-containing protein [Parcubacteria group bacterium]|jgi:hypothetical protein